MQARGALGHFDPVVPDALGSLPDAPFRHLLLLNADSGREFLSGVKR